MSYKMSAKMIFIISLIFMFSLIFCQKPVSNERLFTYVYQSTIMGKGSKEIEITTTPRLGKQFGYFAAIDNRMEFEVGLSKKLQTAFYINFTNTTTDNGSGTNQTKFEFKGISTEWKYQFSNPYIDAFGFAAYSELSLNTSEVELETKLIFDKKIKKTTLALNFTYEPEWYLSPGKADLETNFEGTFGLSYAFSPNLSAGFETRDHNIYTKQGGWENSALFAGPVISYSQSTWWVTFTVLPQIVALKGKTQGSKLNLNDHERFEARMIFSLHL
jgi:hypothetical protein